MTFPKEKLSERVCTPAASTSLSNAQTRLPLHTRWHAHIYSLSANLCGNADLRGIDAAANEKIPIAGGGRRRGRALEIHQHLNERIHSPITVSGKNDASKRLDDMLGVAKINDKRN